MVAGVAMMKRCMKSVRGYVCANIQIANPLEADKKKEKEKKEKRSRLQTYLVLYK